MMDNNDDRDTFLYGYPYSITTVDGKILESAMRRDASSCWLWQCSIMD